MDTDTSTVRAWIDGAPGRGGGGAPVELHSPYDGSHSTTVIPGGEEAIDAAALSARRAFAPWAQLALGERADLLEAAATEVTRLADAIVEAMIADIGKPRRAAGFETNRTAAFMRSTARAVHGLTGEVLPLDSTRTAKGLYGFSRRVPYGVVGAVTPFNAPANLLMQKVAPAIAAGNTVVVKPSLEGTRVALLLAAALKQAGIPDGVCNVVPGGAEEALALARHPQVDLVTITGGTAAGEALAREAGVRKFLGELGGNSANVVLADARLEDAAKRIAVSAFEASGQQCISAQRIIVEDGVYDAFLELFVNAADQLKVGDPADKDTDLGPVVHARAAERIMRMIEEATGKGARLVREPRREGCIIHPTIMADVPAGCGVIATEIFGPVAVVMRAKDFDEAIALANDCDFALQASVFTTSLERALKASDRLRSGSVWVNEGSRFRLDNYPFGGMGKSGHGREGVRYALEEYTQWKFTGIRLPD